VRVLFQIRVELVTDIGGHPPPEGVDNVIAHSLPPQMSQGLVHPPGVGSSTDGIPGRSPSNLNSPPTDSHVPLRAVGVVDGPGRHLRRKTE
jgi:hypothetical protein